MPERNEEDAPGPAGREPILRYDAREDDPIQQRINEAWKFWKDRREPEPPFTWDDLARQIAALGDAERQQPVAIYRKDRECGGHHAEPADVQPRVHDGSFALFQERSQSAGVTGQT